MPQFKAKVVSYGFQNRAWNVGDVAEVSSEDVKAAEKDLIDCAKEGRKRPRHPLNCHFEKIGSNGKAVSSKSAKADAGEDKAKAKSAAEKVLEEAQAALDKLHHNVKAERREAAEKAVKAAEEALAALA